MVYLDYITCLRYTIPDRNPRIVCIYVYARVHMFMYDACLMCTRICICVYGPVFGYVRMCMFVDFVFASIPLCLCVPLCK